MKSFLKKAVILIICLSLVVPFMPCISASGEEIPISSISARSAVLIDAQSDQLLFSKNPHARMGMASTTKIMTAMVALSFLSLEEKVVIPKEAVGIEGSSVYLCEGEILTVKDLIHALLLSSANDAAVALAIAACGSVDDFVAQMNKRAAEMGLSDTSFENPHGLDGKNHYTTAYELAIISSQALKNDVLKSIFSAKTAIIPQGVTKESEKPESFRKLYNHNKMLSRYEGAIGMKTGFTKKNGRCLVSAAERNGLALIAVTLNAPDDWNDHTKMLNYGFSSYESITLFQKGEFLYSFPVSNGTSAAVMLTNSQPISLVLPKNSKPPRTSVQSTYRFAIAPVYRRCVLAELHVTAGDKTASSPLVATDDIEKRN